MKSLVLFVCLVYTVFASLEEDREQWANFKTEHGKSYRNQQEEKLRFSIFQENVRKIEDHNKQFTAGNTTYTMGINRFADFTQDELIAKLKRQTADRSQLGINSVYKPKGLQVPDALDWRDYGAVSPIKDQSDCGSCWAFSVTGTLEGFNFLKTNVMTTYSEQQLVDCLPEYGCEGGDEPPTLAYVQQYGIESEESYPYEVYAAQCRYDANKVALWTNGYILTESKNEGALKEVLGSLGPISVALDVTNLFFYKSGVFTDNACSEDVLNHAVLAIAYGHDDQSGLDYWTIKNSWGLNWGDQGYFKIKRGSNECGIATECVYPVLY